jgi:hypothetical protein
VKVFVSICRGVISVHARESVLPLRPERGSRPLGSLDLWPPRFRNLTRAGWALNEEEGEASNQSVEVAEALVRLLRELGHEVGAPEFKT